METSCRLPENLEQVRRQRVVQPDVGASTGTIKGCLNARISRQQTRKKTVGGVHRRIGPARLVSNNSIFRIRPLLHWEEDDAKGLPFLLKLH